MAGGGFAAGRILNFSYFSRQGTFMNKTLISLFAGFALLAAPANAEDTPAVVDALSGYMDFAEYSSSLIWPEQIPKDDWNKVFIVDARDADHIAKEHIPGVVNIDWRPSVARRSELTENRQA